MALFGRKNQMPTPDEALPGRDDKMPVPAAHFVNGHTLEPPFPDGLELAMFGLGCFWGAERLFWELPGVYTTAVGYAGGITPNPSYQEVCSGRTGHTEAVLVVFDPAVITYDQLLKTLLGGPQPHPGDAPGQRRRHAVPLRHLHVQRRAARGREDVTRHVPRRAERRGLRRDHHRDPARAHLLLRRGLSPAVPGEEPRRLLRPGRHRA